MTKTIIALCDYTGIMAQPWIEAGHRAVLVDPQHGETLTLGKVTYLACTVLEALPKLHKIIASGDVAFVAAFPPCTDLAVSGAAHFEAKIAADKHVQTRAALVAEQCRVVGALSGAPYFVENPVSVLSSIFGPPDWVFDPYLFGGYLPEDDVHPRYPDYIAPRDAYPKKTCLWSGNGFMLPPLRPVTPQTGYSTQHLKLGGKSLKTKNIRSATPRGFARAVFEMYGR